MTFKTKGSHYRSPAASDVQHYWLLLAASIAFTLLLNGRTRNRAIRAEHAAIPGLGPQQRAAAEAIIKKLAGVSRHGFACLMAAFGAGQGAFKNNFGHGLLFSLAGKPASVIARDTAATVVLAGS